MEKSVQIGTSLMRSIHVTAGFCPLSLVKAGKAEPHVFMVSFFFKPFLKVVEMPTECLHIHVRPGDFMGTRFIQRRAQARQACPHTAQIHQGISKLS